MQHPAGIFSDVEFRDVDLSGRYAGVRPKRSGGGSAGPNTPGRFVERLEIVRCPPGEAGDSEDRRCVVRSCTRRPNEHSEREIDSRRGQALVRSRAQNLFDGVSLRVVSEIRDERHECDKSWIDSRIRPTTESGQLARLLQLVRDRAINSALFT